MNQFIKITPRPDCKTCYGLGMVRGDSVPMPFGKGATRTPDEFCDCVLDQVPDGDNKEIEIEVAPEVLAGIERARDVDYELASNVEPYDFPEIKDDYDYAADDRNFDADRERRYFRR